MDFPGRLCTSLALLAAFWLPQVHAEPLTSPTLAAVHQRMLADPTNLDLAYAYAQAAIDEGNYEAAIAALEGMLVTDRRQPRLLLELGVLYQRLGSPNVARIYLDMARSYAGSDSPLFDLSEPYMSEVEDTLSDNAWSGYLKFGLRYQSNPSQGPDGGQIYANGSLVPRPSGLDDDDDTGIFALALAENRYRLSDDYRLATTLAGYASVQSDQSELNLGALEVSSGPLFDTRFGELVRYSVRPHVLLRGTLADGEVFEKTAGLGVDLTSRTRENDFIKASYQFRDSDFSEINSGSDDRRRSGDEHRLDLTYRTEVKRGHALSVRLFGQVRDAEAAHYSRDLVSVTLRYSRRLANFLLPDERDMTLSPYLVWQNTRYDQANPAIDPSTTRHDREMRFGLTTLVPVASGWSAFVNLEHTEVDSNIVNFDADNTALMLGMQKGF